MAGFPDHDADFRGLAERSPVVLYVAARGKGGRWLYAGPGIEDLVGIRRESLLEDPYAWDSRVHPADRKEANWRAGVSLFDGEVPRGSEYRMIRPDGSVVWILDRAELAAGPGGATVWHGALQDITVRKSTELALQRLVAQEGAIARLRQLALSGADPDAMLAAAIESAQSLDGVVQCFVWEGSDPEGPLLVRAGSSMPEGTDWRSMSAGPATHVGTAAARRPYVVVADWDVERELELPPLLEDLRVRSSLAVRIEGEDGLLGVLDVHAAEPGAFTADDAHFLATAAGVLSHAQLRRRADETMRRRIYHDGLTGLPNRLLFLEDVETALAGGFAGGAAVAVLFLDLDRFKLINDSLGHHAGDDLLRAVAPRLRQQLRAGDTVARFGGDEFAVLISSADADQEALAVAERIGRAFEAPFLIGGIEHFVTASIGIAIAPAGSLGAGAAESLIRDADAAMYRAKEKGRSRYEFFDREMRAKAVRRLEVEVELRRAIERDELTLHYQPIVSLPSGQLRGLEALVRWRHPERGLLSPGEFIEVAEDTGLIDQIGRWVQERACLQLLAWHELTPETRRLQMSVNLSARQVAHRELPQIVGGVLARTGLEPGLLRLEVTESMLVEESGWADHALQSLHALGVKLALDDFGTGYSSLAYLNRFPFDSLKIDRSFVEDLGVDEEREAIVEAIVGMARALDLVVVAEGVERDLQLRELNRLGCEFAQGYLFARPAPPETITELLLRPPPAIPRS